MPLTIVTVLMSFYKSADTLWRFCRKTADYRRGETTDFVKFLATCTVCTYMYVCICIVSDNCCVCCEFERIWGISQHGEPDGRGFPRSEDRDHLMTIWAVTYYPKTFAHNSKQNADFCQRGKGMNSRFSWELCGSELVYTLTATYSSILVTSVAFSLLSISLARSCTGMGECLSHWLASCSVINAFCDSGRDASSVPT